MRRRSLLALTLVALTAAAVAWTLEVRSRSAAPDFLPAAPPAVAAGAHPSLDTGEAVWHMPAYDEAPRSPRAEAPERVPVPAPDWAALRVDVAGAATPAPAPVSLALATPPAELEVAMSARERRALIASAREAELPGTPRGYRPGIAVIVPGGSSADGVCR
jgi:hypothetical protein